MQRKRNFPPLRPVSHRIAAWLGRPKPETSSQQVDEFKASLCSTIGGRNENQDRVLAVRFLSEDPTASFFLFAVCDGMGGMQQGSRCAELALGAIVGELLHQNGCHPSLRIRDAVNSASAAVFLEHEENGGATLSLAWLPKGGVVYCANVGDCRIHQYLGKAGLKQTSIDDNVASQVQMLNLASGVSVASSIGRHITQFIGMDAAIESHSFYELDCSEGPILLSSDGAYGQIGQDLMGKVFAAANSHMEVPRRLVSLSKWLATKDNASAVVFDPACATLHEQLNSGGSGVCEIWDDLNSLEILELGPPPDNYRQSPSYRPRRSKQKKPQSSNKEAQAGKPAGLVSDKTKDQVEIKFEIGGSQ